MAEQIISKRCSKCKQNKPPSEFSRNKSKKDRLNHYCKECKSKSDKHYYARHKEKHLRYSKFYQENHKEQRRQIGIRYSAKHKEQIREYQKQWCKTIRGYLWYIWNGMLQRCNNPKNKGYKYYGGRGIKVKFVSFNEFFNYVANNLKIDPRGLTIDRIDNEGHYDMGNIRFITQAENNQNRRKRG